MILVINSGSTSLKYKTFSLEDLTEITTGSFKVDGQEIRNHAHAVRLTLREIADITKIKAVGHRVVHGGSSYTETTKITKKNLSALQKLSNLAPLHNPANLQGIEHCYEYLPNVKQYAIFDTAFFNDLPAVANTYPLPSSITKKYKIERFGFHGLSHSFALTETARQLKKPSRKINLISCHLGGGSSITAIKSGQAVDTSMGFTPLEGLMMLSRPGDLDAGIILYLLEQGLTLEELKEILNHQSGIKGIASVKNYLDLLKNKSTEPNAKLAFDMFIYRIRKYIGSYLAILPKTDAIVFTGQIGCGDPRTRQTITRNFPLIQGIKRLSFAPDEELIIASEVKAKIYE